MCIEKNRILGEKTVERIKREADGIQKLEKVSGK